VSAAAHEAAEALTRAIATGGVPIGSLRVFGDSSGRRDDNRHRPVAAESSDWLLTIRFDGGETLQVWTPAGVTLTPPEFRIRTAARVRWEWFFYGREHTPANLEHWIEDGRVRATSTVDWFKPSFTPSLGEPAVELG
jgi:hypothetical protein